MMPSSNDDPSSHYESKLAAAGYYHSEVLENVQGFDHNGSDGSLLDEKAGQQTKKSKSADANRPNLQRPSSSSALRTTTSSRHLLATPGKENQTMEYLDQIQKEAILLALSDDDELDYEEGAGEDDNQ
jgi:hypothetical protein